jgi:hypothetical protein
MPNVHETARCLLEDSWAMKAAKTRFEQLEIGRSAQQ